MPSIKIGDSFETNNFGTCSVVAYKSALEVYVQFGESPPVRTRVSDLRSGEVKNPFKRVKYEIGFIGVGEYSTKTHRYLYDLWSAMFQRCYDKKFLEINPTYSEVFVSDRWHNFQNFAKDVLEMKGSEFLRSTGTGSSYQLDKDLLVKGNKMYSKDTCCLLPKDINNALVKKDSCRGDLPIGVCRINSYKNPYRAAISTSGVVEYLGCYPTPELAFQAYKERKELLFRELAGKYKNSLDERAYTALMSYEISIDD